MTGGSFFVPASFNKQGKAFEKTVIYKNRMEENE